LNAMALLAFPTRRSSELVGSADGIGLCGGKPFEEADHVVAEVTDSSAVKARQARHVRGAVCLEKPAQGLEGIAGFLFGKDEARLDRKSTRLNSSHVKISY